MFLARARRQTVDGMEDGVVHAEFFGAMAEFLDVAGTVEHGVIGVEMKVDELGHPRSLILTACARKQQVKPALGLCITRPNWHNPF